MAASGCQKCYSEVLLCQHISILGRIFLSVSHSEEFHHILLTLLAIIQRVVRRRDEPAYQASCDIPLHQLLPHNPLEWGHGLNVINLLITYLMSPWKERLPCRMSCTELPAVCALRKGTS